MLQGSFFTLFENSKVVVILYFYLHCRGATGGIYCDPDMHITGRCLLFYSCGLEPSYAANGMKLYALLQFVMCSDFHINWGGSKKTCRKTSINSCSKQVSLFFSPFTFFYSYSFIYIHSASVGQKSLIGVRFAPRKVRLQKRTMFLKHQRKRGPEQREKKVRKKRKVVIT